MFYFISTLVGYLIPNPIHTYCIYMYSILFIQIVYICIYTNCIYMYIYNLFLHSCMVSITTIYFLHTVKWLNNSIWHHKWDTNRYYHPRTESTCDLCQWRGTPHFQTLQDCNLITRLFSEINSIHTRGESIFIIFLPALFLIELPQSDFISDWGNSYIHTFSQQSNVNSANMCFQSYAHIHTHINFLARIFLKFRTFSAILKDTRFLGGRGSYPSAEMESEYSTVPADLAYFIGRKTGNGKIFLWSTGASSLQKFSSFSKRINARL